MNRNPASLNPTTVVSPLDTKYARYNERDGQMASRSASMDDLSMAAQRYQWGAGAGMLTGRSERRDSLGIHPAFPSTAA